MKLSILVLFGAFLVLQSTGAAPSYYGSGTSFKLDEKESGVDETPSPEEKRAMDREYHVWWFIVGALSIIATLLYLVPYLARLVKPKTFQPRLCDEAFFRKK